MATNFYLDNFSNRQEQNLVEDLTIEAIKMYGMDMIYLPRNIVEQDDLFGEDIVTKFEANYMLEMYVESVDGFDGGQDVLAKFGMQIVDQASFVVSRRRFEEVVFDHKRPMEGDLIYFPLSNTLFEVNHVEHENPFYQMGKLYTYKITVEAYTHSHEDFNTGMGLDAAVEGVHGKEAAFDRADNETIQIEADEVKVFSTDDNDYPTVDDDTSFDPDDPFGGL